MRAGRKAQGAWSRSLLAMVLMACGAFGQTADDPGEGLRAELGGTGGSMSVRWWGKTGTTYFMQTSTTLYPWDWSYLPVVEAGGNAVQSYGLPITQERLFVRLVCCDHVYTTATPGEADFDEDGLTNAEELAPGLGTDPLRADTDLDGYSDSEEVAAGTNATNPNSNTGSKGVEKGGVEKPVFLFGYEKTVSNDWYSSSTSNSQAYWFDSTPTSGSTTYQGFSPQYESRLAGLAYPSPSEMFKLMTLGNRALSEAWLHTSAVVGRAYIKHRRVSLATTSRGDVQPWVVTRQCLLFNSSLANNQPASAATFGDTSLVQMNIPKDGEVSTSVDLEPAIESGFMNRKALVIPEVAGWSTTTDTMTTLGGKHGVSAGIPDYWIMLPKDTPKVISVGSSLDTAGLRTAYRFSGEVQATGTDVTAQVARAPVPYTAVELVSSEEGEVGAIHVGVAAGTDGPMKIAENRPLMKIECLPQRSLNIVVHPIQYKDASGQTTGTVDYLPSQAQLEAYLNSIFGVKANVWCTVTYRNVRDVRWDVGLNLPDWAPNQHNNQILDAFNSDTTGVPKTYQGKPWTPEEQLILDASLPDSNAVNVYYVATPKTVDVGLQHFSYFPVTDPRHQTWAQTSQRTVLGWAGKATSGVSGGVLWVYDYVRFDMAPYHMPPHTFAIAHEIMHYVAKVGHSTDGDLPGQYRSVNHLPNSDNESRLMTGLELGPKRGAGPKTLIRKEWSRLNWGAGWPTEEVMYDQQKENYPYNHPLYSE